MIDYVILTSTRSERDYLMTDGLVKSLRATVYPAENGLESYRATLVESNPGSGGFVYPGDCKVVLFDMSKYGMFNYNYALNIGQRACPGGGGDDWFCFLNNDVVCDPDWVLEISKAVTADPSIESVSPNTRGRGEGVKYGYTLFEHLDGCCIMCRRRVMDKIGEWDEAFDFSYQDDDYLERCRRAGVVHARPMASHVTHLGSQTVNYTNKLAMRGLRAFAAKWSRETLTAREAEKNAFMRRVNSK